MNATVNFADIQRELNAVRILLDAVSQQLAIAGYSPVPSKRLTASAIITAVAEHFKYSPEELTGKSRVRELAWARHVAMLLIRDTCQMSLKDVSVLFKLDHSGVAHAHRRVTDVCTVDARAKAQVEMIRKQFMSKS